MTLDPNLTLVLLALVGIVVPLATLWVKYVQDKRIADEAREMRLAQAAAVDEKLEGIHALVNSQLTDAVNRFNEALTVIDHMKQLLAAIAPDDPRVQAIMKTLMTIPQAAKPK